MIPAPPSKRRLKIQDFAKQYPNFENNETQITELKNEWMNTVKHRDDKSQNKSLTKNEYSQQDASEFIYYYIQDLPLPKINVKVQVTHTYSDNYSSCMYTSDELYTDEDGDEKKEDVMYERKILQISNDIKKDYTIQ